MRPTTPKSPVFEDMEGSDEEDHVLQNEDEQNYSINEEMGIDGDGSGNMIMDADAIVGDGMVRLACGNNLLRSEPTMLRQRLKVMQDYDLFWVFSFGTGSCSCSLSIALVSSAEAYGKHFAGWMSLDVN